MIVLHPFTFVITASCFTCIIAPDYFLSYLAVRLLYPISFMIERMVSLKFSTSTGSTSSIYKYCMFFFSKLEKKNPLLIFCSLLLYGKTP